MALDMSVNKLRTRVTLTQGHKYFITRILSHSCRLQQNSEVHHRLILGLKRGLCWLSVLLTHCIQCGSGKAKTFQEPYTHALLIPYIELLEADILSDERSGSGFPCTSFPHCHYPNITLLQSRAGQQGNSMKRMKSNIEQVPHASSAHPAALSYQGPMEKTACERITHDCTPRNTHAPRAAHVHLNTRFLCFQVLNPANQMTLTYFVGSNQKSKTGKARAKFAPSNSTKCCPLQLAKAGKMLKTSSCKEQTEKLKNDHPFQF